MHVRRLLMPACALALALPGNALAQFLEPDVEVLGTFVAENSGDGFGFVAETVGDLDADGVADFVIGAPGFPAGNFDGKVYAYSGATGALLHAVTGGGFEGLGFSVAALGDVDGDGVADYATGGPFAGADGLSGRVLIISGATGAIVHELLGDPFTLLGYDLHELGDVDADGVPDLAVGLLIESGAFSVSGSVAAVSGATGARIWTTAGFADNARMGSAVGGLPDATGDGVPDFIAGARNDGPGAEGRAYLLSGSDGSVVHELAPLPNAVDFGWFFTHPAGDVNADGSPDIYVGDFNDTALGPASGRAYVYSASDGVLLQVYDAYLAGEGFGIGRAAGDVDGDGHGDLFLAGYTNGLAAPNAGRGYLLSGRDQSLIRSMTGTAAQAFLGFDALPVGDANGDGLTDFLLTGVDIAYTIAGVDASPAARIAAACEVLQSIPASAFSDALRADKLCARLHQALDKLADDDLIAVAERIAQVLRRLDGFYGGNPDNDWLVDEQWQRYAYPLIAGVATMVDSLAAD